MKPEELYELNRRAWNTQSKNQQSRWTEPVSAGEIAAAREGSWQVILTPTLPVPQTWFGPNNDSNLLALASGGGQQVPILAAAGFNVTSFDASEEQLEKDVFVADRDMLTVTTEQGDMADLGRFDDRSFDVVFNPVSNVFAVDVPSIWQECARVLRPGGRLLAGFMNPDFFLFDHEKIEHGGPLEVKFTLPFSDSQTLSTDEQLARVESGFALEFSHSLNDQIGAQLEAGLLLHGFYEDRWDDGATPLNRFMPTSMATLAIKPEG